MLAHIITRIAYAYMECIDLNLFISLHRLKVYFLEHLAGFQTMGFLCFSLLSLGNPAAARM